MKNILVPNAVFTFKYRDEILIYASVGYLLMPLQKYNCIFSGQNHKCYHNLQ